MGFSKLTRWLREFDFPSFLDQRENQRHYYSATGKLKLDPFHLVSSRHITFKILLLCTFSLPWSMPFYSSMAINLFRAESFNQIKIRLCSNLTFSQSHNSRLYMIMWALVRKLITPWLMQNHIIIPSDSSI